MKTKILALQELHNKFENSFLIRLLFPSLKNTLKTLNSFNTIYNEDRLQALELLSFQQANTTLFNFYVRMINFFSGSPSITFFSDPRVQAWQALQNHDLLDKEDASKNFNVISQSSNIESDLSTLIILQNNNLLNDQNRNGIIECKNREILSCIQTLNINNLLKNREAQKYLDALYKHHLPSAYTTALIRFEEKGLLSGNQSQDIFNAITARNISITAITNTIIILHDNELLNNKNLSEIVKGDTHFSAPIEWINNAGLLKHKNAQAYLDAIYAHSQPNLLASALVALQKKNMLDGNAEQEIFTAIKSHQHPESLANALVMLHENNALNEENRAAVSAELNLFESLPSDEHDIADLEILDARKRLSGKAITDIASALIILKDAGLSTKENREEVLSSKPPKMLYSHTADNLVILNKAKLLEGKFGKNNLLLAKTTPKPMLTKLEDNHLLTDGKAQENFTNLNNNLNIIWTLEIISRFPNNINQEQWDYIIALCDQHRENIEDAINSVIEYLENTFPKENALRR